MGVPGMWAGRVRAWARANAPASEGSDRQTEMWGALRRSHITEHVGHWEGTCMGLWVACTAAGLNYIVSRTSRPRGMAGGGSRGGNGGDKTSLGDGGDPANSLSGVGAIVASFVPAECGVYSESPRKGLFGSPRVCMLY